MSDFFYKLKWFGEVLAGAARLLSVISDESGDTSGWFYSISSRLLYAEFVESGRRLFPGYHLSQIALERIETSPAKLYSSLHAISDRSRSVTGLDLVSVHSQLANYRGWHQLWCVPQHATAAATAAPGCFGRKQTAQATATSRWILIAASHPQFHITCTVD